MELLYDRIAKRAALVARLMVARLTVALSAAAVLAVLVAPGEAFGQAPGDDVLQRVEQAFARGDEGTLMGHAADRLEVALLGDNMLYSGAQAAFVLKNFFRDHPPERFTFTEVTRTPKRIFVVGRYWPQHAERPMKVYIRLQLRTPSWEIQGVRVDQRNTP